MTEIEEQTDIRPNYSLIVQQIHIRTARYILSHQPNIILLHGGIGQKRNVSDLPSWVPDWTAQQSQIYVAVFPAGQGYSACGPGPLNSPLLALSPNLLEISIQAVPRSQILHVSPVARPTPARGQQIEAKSFKSFYQAARLMVFSHCPKKYTLTNQNRAEAFWRTLIAIGINALITNLMILPVFDGLHSLNMSNSFNCGEIARCLASKIGSCLMTKSRLHVLHPVGLWVLLLVTEGSLL
jgi:hypothetical protein